MAKDGQGLSWNKKKGFYAIFSTF